MATDLSTIKAPLAALPARPAMGQLSFTGRRSDGGVNLWSPPETESGWEKQCHLGREFGREALDYIRETSNAALLPGIVRMISERGTFGGVETGFFAAISMALAQAA